MFERLEPEFKDELKKAMNKTKKIDSSDLIEEPIQDNWMQINDDIARVSIMYQIKKDSNI
jgi:hypothetical protein